MSDSPAAANRSGASWSPDWSNAVFSLEERDRRWSGVRRKMVERGVDLIVCLPCTSRHDRGAADARYLSQLGENEDEVTLAFPIEGEPTAWQSRAGVWPGGNWLSDIRAAGRGTGGRTIAAWLAENPRYGRATIAIAGLDAGPLSCVRAAEGEVSWRSLALLQAGFPDARFVSATPILGAARWRKSAEEVIFLRRGTEVAEATLLALKQHARTGVRERHVFAQMMFANADAGGSFPPMIGWVSGPAEALPHRLEQPTFRSLAHGDLMQLEIEGRWGGYIAQIDETVAIGAASADLTAAIGFNIDVFERALAAMKTGATIRDVLQAARIEGLGGRVIGELKLHGRGTGDDGPLVGAAKGEPPEILDLVLEENCCFCLKPTVRFATARDYACRWGDSVVVTAAGGQRLGTRPQSFAVL